MEGYHLSSSEGGANHQHRQQLTINTTNCQSFGAAVKDFPEIHSRGEKEVVKKQFLLGFEGQFFPDTAVTAVAEHTLFCCSGVLPDSSCLLPGV